MYKNIKSDYFKKILLLHLDERKLLQLINYNKELQNLMDIKLICFKINSGKIIIGERSGLGKELDYFTNKILFEGEYLNGKRNGNGIEYHKNGGKIFEGEYINGKRHGKGKEYFWIEQFEFYFEGNYLNGKIWNGFQYGQIITESEIKNGSGFIIESSHYSPCETYIECEYKNGEKNGKGEESYYFCCEQCGIDMKFEGEYLNGKKWNGIVTLYPEQYELKNGKGYIIDMNSECFYEGEFVNGEKNGKGKEYYGKLSGISYEGEYLNNKRHGKGKEYYKDNNLRFEGSYKCGFKSEGKEYYPNGKLLFKGKYKSGVKWNGEGYDEKGNNIYKINNGRGFIKEYKYKYYGYYYLYLVFEGQYLNGEKHGKGKEYDERGEIVFEGEYYEGKRWNGKGNVEEKENRQGMAKFESEYINGKRKGKEYTDKGEIIFEGEYYFDQRWNGKGKEYNDKKEVIFEGKYYKGQRWNGEGKEYNYNEEIIFEGEYLNGKKWSGKIYDYKDKKIFENEVLNGIKSENFIEYDNDNMEKNKRISLDENYEQIK